MQIKQFDLFPGGFSDAISARGTCNSNGFYRDSRVVGSRSKTNLAPDEARPLSFRIGGGLNILSDSGNPLKSAFCEITIYAALSASSAVENLPDVGWQTAAGAAGIIPVYSCKDQIPLDLEGASARGIIPVRDFTLDLAAIKKSLALENQSVAVYLFAEIETGFHCPGRVIIDHCPTVNAFFLTVDQSGATVEKEFYPTIISNNFSYQSEIDITVAQRTDNPYNRWFISFDAGTGSNKRIYCTDVIETIPSAQYLVDQHGQGSKQKCFQEIKFFKGHPMENTYFLLYIYGYNWGSIMVSISNYGNYFSADDLIAGKLIVWKERIKADGGSGK